MVLMAEIEWSYKCDGDRAVCGEDVDLEGMAMLKQIMMKTWASRLNCMQCTGRPLLGPRCSDRNPSRRLDDWCFRREWAAETGCPGTSARCSRLAPGIWLQPGRVFLRAAVARDADRP